MRIGDDRQYVSTIQAAEALGVSVSTVKRWVDDGVLPAHRTAGGHRKLLRAEVLVLARHGGMARGDLAALSAASPRDQRPDLDKLTADLIDALQRGQGSEVTAIIRRAYWSGAAIEALADGVIAPVMARIGHDWEAARIDVWQEHRATQLCAAALYDLKDELEARAELNRPVALGGSAEGDHYLLPTVLAQLVLLDAGWEAVQLGPNTPLNSLSKAIEFFRPRLVWLSVSHLVDTAHFVSAFRDFYRTAERQGVAVAIGGRALTEDIRSAVPYTTYGDGMSNLAAFARTFHPRPKPPRRGRPSMRR
jgi:excisionase family DNA binding protein